MRTLIHPLSAARCGLLLALCWLLVGLAPALAQRPTRNFDKRYGGPAGSGNYLDNAVPTADGGYVLLGQSNSGVGGIKTTPGYGSNDLWLVKVDASGNVVWQRTYGGTNDDISESIIPTPAVGGFLLLASSNSGIGGNKTTPQVGLYDMWVIKVDNNGNKVWEKTLGGGNWEIGLSALATADGGYLLGGRTQSDVSGDVSEPNWGGVGDLTDDAWVIKLNASGVKQWDHRFGTSGQQEGFDGLLETAAGYLAIGQSDGTGGNRTAALKDTNGDAWVVALSTTGAKLWDQSYGGLAVNSLHFGENLYSGVATPDGGYLLAGEGDGGAGNDKTENSRGTRDGWVVKIAANGTRQWDKTLGGSNDDNFSTIVPALGGGYLLTGYTQSPVSGDVSQAPLGSVGGADVWLTKITTTATAATKLWDGRYGGSGDDYGNNVARQSSNGSIVLVASIDSPISGDVSQAPYGINDYWLLSVTEPCGAMSGVSAGSITQTSASVSFTGTANAGSYTVTYTPQGGATQTIATTGSPVALTGLTAGTLYNVSVVSNCVQSATAATTSFTTTSAAATCNAVTTLAAGSITQTSASLSFTAASGATNYTVTYTPQGGAATTVSPAPTASPVSLTGLTAGTLYNVSVVTNCASGGTSTAATTSFTTTAAAATCATVSNLSLSNITASAVQLNFTAAPGAADYTVDYTPQGGTTLTLSPNPTASPVVISGLTPATSYLVRITTNCTNGGTSSPLSRTFTTATAAATTFTWTGSSSTAWTTAANWSGSQVPAAADDVTIPAGATRYPVLTGSPSFAARALAVANGATLTLNDGVLDLKGDFTNNGTLAQAGGEVALTGASAQSVAGSSPYAFFNLRVGPAGASLSGGPVSIARVLTLTGNLATGNRLTLLSTAAGTAMVVNSGGVATGPATAQRYVDGTLNPGTGYRHFASSVSGATVADLHGPGQPAPAVNPNYNTDPNPYAVTPFPTAFTYNESRLTTTTATSSGFDFGWQSPTLADPLVAGQGYSVNLAPTTLAFTGTLRTGSQSVALTRGSTANAGWQLLGNPYPAPLNWDNLARPAGLDNALYVFRSNGPYGGAYVSYVNGMGPAGANLVANGQGFFARVSAGQSSATLTFTDAARETSYASPVQYRGPAETRPILELALRGPAATAPVDVLYVYQEAGASARFDARYDAVKVTLNGGSQPTLYQQAGPDALSIQGLPATAQPQALPLGVNAPQAGAFTFSAQHLVNFPAATTLYLEDRQTGTWHDLRGTAPYTATLPQGLSTQRFVLHLNAQRPLATTASAQPFAELQVYPNPAAAGQATVTVVAQGDAAALQQGRVELLNALGQRVYQAAAPAATAGALRLTLPTQGLAAGLYTVRLTTATGVLTRKLLLN